MLTLESTELIFSRESASNLSKGIDWIALFRTAVLDVPWFASGEAVVGEAADAKLANSENASPARQD
jgi:hypothetical protein